MRGSEEDDVALKLVHTADWHLGRRFPSFAEADRVRLSRARLEVIDRILLVGDRHGADAILCAGDLFDEPDPGPEWWGPLLEKLERHSRSRPVFLLPGNHDPLVPTSVWAESHPFRRALPASVHVVDADPFVREIGPDAMLYAAPCRSQAGQRDLALSLPSREPGDERIRIGLVHGSTFDLEGCQTNFPIAKDAAIQRGFDYLAIGDTHGFRAVPPNAKVPTVYPGAPEATCFGEPDAGSVAVVFVTRQRRAIVRPERVAHWTWEEAACRSLTELRALRDGGDRSRQVLRLTVAMRLAAPELEEAEAILRELRGTEAVQGRVGILQLDRAELLLDPASIDDAFADLPDVLRATAERLKALTSGPEGDVARRALLHLYRTARGAGACA
jgi:DNA repair exonuclease SbcCD nuclease subunit